MATGLPKDDGTLHSHSYRVSSGQLTLRPMTESDWSNLLRWNQDPRVLVYWDAGNTQPWSLDKLQTVYRGISRTALMFMVEFEGNAVGEAWLQRMNLADIRERLPGLNLWRIDLSIGVPEVWNHGLGTMVVEALIDLGFISQSADALFACHVADDNPRSRRVFEKNGFVEWGLVASSDDTTESCRSCHLVLTRSSWLERPKQKTLW